MIFFCHNGTDSEDWKNVFNSSSVWIALMKQCHLTVKMNLMVCSQRNKKHPHTKTTHITIFLVFFVEKMTLVGQNW